ncbi:MAG: peptidase M15 [Verrucomicrobia bacterium]|nr:MAG: peptidase M15 [Verrucomicrobiota bacterium]
MARIIFAIFLLGPPVIRAEILALPTDDFAWVNLRTTAPAIRIELRYATSQNIAQRPLYPSGMQPIIRAGVARRLITAQAILRRYNRGLKIWDAYRPCDAQAQLWRMAPKNDYVVNPRGGSGSLHSWGVAIDATLVDDWGRPLSMPTDFDDFTPAAMLRYTGNDPIVRTHLYLLQTTMANAGFYGLRTEWWHFTTSDWKRYVPERLARLSNAVVLPTIK